MAYSQPASGGSSAVGGQDNRKRNTAANQLSKYQTDYKNPGGMAALPALSPAQTANQYAQLAGLAAQFQNTVADLRQQRVGLKAGWGAQRAQIRAQEMSDLSGTENSNISRGVQGSSASNAALIGVQAGAAGQMQQGKAALYQGLAQNRIAGQRAYIDFFQGQTQVQAQGLAEQQTALASQLQNDLIISGQETQTDYVRQLYQSLLDQISGGGAGGGTGLAALLSAPPTSYGENPYSGGVTGPNARTGNPGYGRQGGTGWVHGGRT